MADLFVTETMWFSSLKHLQSVTFQNEFSNPKQSGKTQLSNWIYRGRGILVAVGEKCVCVICENWTAFKTWLKF